MPTPRKKNLVKLSTQFEPRFWEDEDGRCAIVKEIRQRFERLASEVDADTHAKELLCQRAIFVSIQLETMECEAATTGKFDPGVYCQMVNALSGLLNKLGLDKKPSKDITLDRYVKRKGKR